MSASAAALAAKRREAADVLDLLPDGADVIVGALNGEPVTVVDAIEAGAGTSRDLRLHQMLPLRDRRYIDGRGRGPAPRLVVLDPRATRAASTRGSATWCRTTSATCRA